METMEVCYDFRMLLYVVPLYPHRVYPLAKVRGSQAALASITDRAFAVSRVTRWNCSTTCNARNAVPCFSLCFILDLLQFYCFEMILY